MKEITTCFVKCPECGAENDLTGVDIGGLDYTTLPVHAKGTYPDASEPHNSMLFAESLNDETTCACSELLVYVQRPDETDKEWDDRHTGNNSKG